MKRFFLTLPFAVLMFYAANAQYLISGTIGHYFIQGNTGVVNTFRTYGAYPAGTQSVDFFITDVSQTTPYASGGGQYDQQYDDFSWDIDMGSISSNAPKNLVAFAYYYDSNNQLLSGSPSQLWPITLTRQPEWITVYNGQVTNTVVNANNTLSMHGQLPLSSLLSLNKNVAGVLGLAGKAFNITNQALDFNILYDNATGLATGSSVSVGGDFQPLGTGISAIDGSNFTGNLTFDSDFNLTFNGVAVFSPPSITKSFQFQNVPLTGANVAFASIGALCVNTSLEFSLAPRFKAQIYAGYDASSQHWGFKQNGSDITQFLGKVEATATAKGELKAVCGSLFGFNMGWGTLARGQVTATLNIGGGIQYRNIPSANTNTLWYGDFNLHAEGQVLGFDTKSGDYNPADWGSSSSFNFKTEEAANDFFESSTQETRSLQTPEAWPMAKIATRDSVAATAWIDDVNFGTNASLLVSYFSPITNSFSPPITVAQNDSGITNHSITLLPNKNIFITWSQLNRSKTQLAGVDLDHVTKSQDIYIAIIDIGSNSVVYKDKLLDASNDRADGEPRIYWGNSNQGIITWQAGDVTGAGGSNIYASKIVQNGLQYSIYNHDVLNTGVAGYNYNLSIAYGNNNEAIATWFNDPDMDQTTNNTAIYYSFWNGSAWWLNPQPRFNVPAGYSIKDYSIAAHDNYGAEVLTYEFFDSQNKTVNGVFLTDWNTGDFVGAHTPIIHEDDAVDFKLPQISVSRNGIASLVLQEKDMLDPNSDGRLNLYLKDVNGGTSVWQEQTNSQYQQFLTDTNQFVWDMSAKFGYLSNSTDVIYLFTQEMDNGGSTSTNSHGAIFGKPNLNLLLRTFEVNDNGGNLSLTDLSEPDIDNVTGFYQELQPFNYSFSLKPAFPNPFSTETYIPYHVYQGGVVTIELFDLKGQSLGQILNASLASGDYVTKFERRGIESGIYFYRVKIGGDVQTGKLVITN